MQTDNGGSDQGVNSGVREKWSDSEYDVTAEPIQWPNVLEGKRN